MVMGCCGYVCRLRESCVIATASLKVWHPGLASLCLWLLLCRGKTPAEYYSRISGAAPSACKQGNLKSSHRQWSCRERRSQCPWRGFQTAKICKGRRGPAISLLVTEKTPRVTPDHPRKKTNSQ